MWVSFSKFSSSPMKICVVTELRNKNKYFISPSFVPGNIYSFFK